MGFIYENCLAPAARSRYLSAAVRYRLFLLSSGRGQKHGFWPWFDEALAAQERVVVGIK